MFEMVCTGCPAVPDPDDTTCRFCKCPDLDEAAIEAIEEKADRYYQNLVISCAGRMLPNQFTLTSDGRFFPYVERDAVFSYHEDDVVLPF